MKRLGDYVEKVCAGGGFSINNKNHRPFNNGTTQEPPLLRPRGVNRILLYPGSFNPPHKGHLALLTHVLDNAGDDLHIAAAILVPTDDETLSLKSNDDNNNNNNNDDGDGDDSNNNNNNSKQPPFVLQKEKRVSLWRGSGALPDSVWVFDGSRDSWRSFRGHLEAALNKDGIELKFVLLGGPDWINATSLHDSDYWGCADAITCDVSRPVDFRYSNTLRQLSGCMVWERVPFDRYRLERQIRAKLRGQSKREIDGAVERAIMKLEAVSVCRTYSKPRGYIRFVPCDLASRPCEAPSSTQIREIIATHPIEQLEMKLADMALNVPLLVEYVGQCAQNGLDNKASRQLRGRGMLQ